MPNQIEPNVNNTLGDLLRGMMPGSKVLSENTQTFPAHPGPSCRHPHNHAGPLPCCG